MLKDYHVIIIGAGVIGLAVARSLAESGHTSVLIVDKEENFGWGTSSRNSEVIHSGIYYQTNSLKAMLCVRGNQYLYDFASQNDIQHMKCGKFIIATDEDQEVTLHQLMDSSLILEKYLILQLIFQKDILDSQNIALRFL